LVYVLLSIVKVDNKRTDLFFLMLFSLDNILSQVYYAGNVEYFYGYVVESGLRFSTE